MGQFGSVRGEDALGRGELEGGAGDEFVAVEAWVDGGGGFDAEADPLVEGGEDGTLEGAVIEGIEEELSAGALGGP
jgi:hypothetical protein